MTLYLDTSIVLSFLLDQTPRFSGWGQWTAAYLSELTGVEARRAFDRLRLAGKIDDSAVADLHEELAQVEASLGEIALTRSVLQRAALPMPTVVKTLDAIHLASALVFREQRNHELVFASYDGGQVRAARALGFRVIG